MEHNAEGKYLSPGVVLDNKYTIKKHLASGGFGHTYLATDRMGQQVVVKEFYLSGVCSRGDDSRMVVVSVAENKPIYEVQKSKFVKEAKRIQSLSHPNIVKVFDLFEENGTAYYVMEYIEGRSLAQVEKPIAEPLLRRYLDQLLSTLEYVHSKGILHLDVKPNNIMIDNNGKAILIDFGASKVFDFDSKAHSVLSTTAGVAYTPGYAPFEQISSQTKKLGTHSDIYSLGATLYNLMTGLVPPSPSDILDGGIPHLNLLSPQMCNLLTKAMAVSVIERIKTVAAFNALFNEVKTIYKASPEETIAPSPKPKKNDSSFWPFLLKFVPVVIFVGLAIYLFPKVIGGDVFTGSTNTIDATSSTNTVTITPTPKNQVEEVEVTSDEKKSSRKEKNSTDGHYYYYGDFTDLEGVVNPVSLQFESKNGKIVNCVYKNEVYGGKIKMKGKWTSDGLYFEAKGADYLKGKKVDFTITLKSNDASNNSMTGHSYVGDKYLDVKLRRK